MYLVLPKLMMKKTTEIVYFTMNPKNLTKAIK